MRLTENANDSKLPGENFYKKVRKISVVGFRVRRGYHGRKFNAASIKGQ